MEALGRLFFVVGLITLLGLTVLGGVEVYNRFELSNGIRAYVERVEVDR